MMDNATPGKIKDANRILYDEVAKNYEAIDGRRSSKLENFIRKELSQLKATSKGERLLDVGTGNGFITRCAKGIFKTRVGLDISPKILSASRDAFEIGVCADVDSLPFSDNSFDAVTCFSVLHHLYGFEEMVCELSRVIKPKLPFQGHIDFQVEL